MQDLVLFWDNMTVEELIKIYYTKNGFLLGTDTVMEALRPNCLYCLDVSGGNFKIVTWDKSNKQDRPSSQEIKEEYIRHKAIKETLEYLHKKGISYDIL